MSQVLKVTESRYEVTNAMAFGRVAVLYGATTTTTTTTKLELLPTTTISKLTVTQHFLVLIHKPGMPLVQGSQVSVTCKVEE